MRVNDDLRWVNNMFIFAQEKFEIGIFDQYKRQ